MGAAATEASGWAAAVASPVGWAGAAAIAGCVAQAEAG